MDMGFLILGWVRVLADPIHTQSTTISKVSIVFLSRRPYLLIKIDATQRIARCRVSHWIQPFPKDHAYLFRSWK